MSHSTSWRQAAPVLVRGWTVALILLIALAVVASTSSPVLGPVLQLQQRAWNPDCVGLAIGERVPDPVVALAAGHRAVVVASQTLIDPCLLPLLEEWGKIGEVTCILVAPVDAPNLRDTWAVIDEADLFRLLDDFALGVDAGPAVFWVDEAGVIVHRDASLRLEHAERADRITHSFACNGTIPEDAVCECWPEAGEPSPSVDFDLFDVEGEPVAFSGGTARFILRSVYTPTSTHLFPFHQDLIELAAAFPEVEFVWILSTTSRQARADLWTYAQRRELSATGLDVYDVPLEVFLNDPTVSELKAWRISGIRQALPGWSVWLDVDDRLAERWLFPRDTAMMILDRSGIVVLPPTTYPRLFDSPTATWVRNPAGFAELRALLDEAIAP